MRTLNLGILAHVDAGKTTLTERLLYDAGVIDRVGSVDDGSTQTDFLPLERQRGITIRSAVVSFVVDGVTINLIDTPGHPDFIAEVERVLNVLDGAVLVISAVEGVQAQTRVLMRTLQRLRIPTLLFVNKIDRGGADANRTFAALGEKLTPSVIAMGRAEREGTRAATVVPYAKDDAAFVAAMAARLAEHDDELLAAYIDGGRAIPYDRLHAALAAQTSRALVHPVFCGSAITGAGVDALTKAITELLPADEADSVGPPRGTCFKIERGPDGEKVAYVRMFAGALRTRDTVGLREDAANKVTAISVFEHGSVVPRSCVAGGHIAKVCGLADVRVGDAIGAPRNSTEHHFAPPTLETAIVPKQPADRGRLRTALDQLAEQDPLINLRQDDVRQEIYVSLYGEVQKEVIEETLRSDFGVEVEFRGTTTICIERPAGVGEAVEVMHVRPNPFLATVGLRVEPAPIGSGVVFRRAVEVLGTLSPAFFRAIEDTVHATLRQGLHGWDVTDCTVTLTHTGYAPRQSHAHQRFNKAMSSTGADFRGLTPLVLMSALASAGTDVHKPVHRFRLEMPADCYGPLLPVLGALNAVPEPAAVRGSAAVVEGEIPAADVQGFRQQLPALTRGEGVLESAFDHYEPARGTPPARPRTDHNPLDRKEYLQHVLRRV